MSDKRGFPLLSPAIWNSLRGPAFGSPSLTVFKPREKMTDMTTNHSQLSQPGAVSDETECI